MAHTALYGGTVYEKKGGADLVGGTVYKKDHGKVLVGGTAYEVGFSGWADDLDTGLEFVSASPFAISVKSYTSMGGTTYYGWNGKIEYCNGKEWVTWDGSEIQSSGSEKGQCIYIRGTGCTRFMDTGGNNYLKLTGTDIECNGNIENLLDYATVKAGGHPTMVSYCFYYLFNRCTTLIKAPDLPATALVKSCYSYMFSGCTSLTTAPTLPATTLAEECYFGMFSNCTGLTTAPTLPATTLAEDCYYDMFRGCTSLTTAPTLPATTLAPYCYYRMFYYCTNLTGIPALRATTLANRCYYGMFQGCRKLKISSAQTGTYTKAYRIPYSGTGATSTNYDLNNMFANTGGTFTEAPTINTTYYLDSSNTIV